MTHQEEYGQNSQELLDKAQEEFQNDDLLQASEKLWGAAAHAVKAVAERRGWRHNGNKLLWRVVAHLADETGDRELHNLFHVANSLHSNFYEDWMTKESIEQGVDQVRELVRRLERID